MKTENNTLELELSEKHLVEWFTEIFPDTPELINEFKSNLYDNPGRISRAYQDLLSGYNSDPKVIIKTTLDIPTDTHEGIVTSRKIPFLSFCAHHFLPYFGTIDIAYQPGSKIIGIGKMPRLVDCRAKRFQIQELLVKEICEDMMEYADAKGCYVQSTAKHMCVCYRGPSMTVVDNQTSYAMGSLSSGSAKNEVIALLNQ